MISLDTMYKKPEIRELKSFITFIREEKGLDLTFYRSTFLLRRLKARMWSCNIGSITNYLEKIKGDFKEWDKLLEVLSINVSEFFRDKEVFDYFSHVCLKELVSRKRTQRVKMIRFWSAGCSLGEEPYSLAILLCESVKDKQDYFFKIYATDIDVKSLEKAKKGIFQESSLKNVSSDFRERYFIKVREDTWMIKDEVKRMVNFRQHNLFDKPLFKYFDVVFCRNVRIYFDNRQSEKVLWNIYNTLSKGGYLVLGKVEILPSSLKDYFVNIESSCKIFQKK